MIMIMIIIYSNFRRYTVSLGKGVGLYAVVWTELLPWCEKIKSSGEGKNMGFGLAVQFPSWIIQQMLPALNYIPFYHVLCSLFQIWTLIYTVMGKFALHYLLSRFRYRINYLIKIQHYSQFLVSFSRLAVGVLAIAAGNIYGFMAICFLKFPPFWSNFVFQYTVFSVSLRNRDTLLLVCCKVWILAGIR